MNSLWQDLRYASRVLLKSPGFTIVAVLTLALGIGATTAIFSVVNAVLLRHLPYRDPERLVRPTQFIPAQGNTMVSDSDYFAWKRRNKVFEDMAAYGHTDYILTGSGDPELIEVGRVTAGFFSVLGVQPVLGRSFLEEDRPRGPQVCILSHELWQKRFSADRSIIGQTITLESRLYTVIGVLPASFEFVDTSHPAVYVPFDLAETIGMDPGEYPHMMVTVIARLKPGITLARAQSDLAVIGKGLQSGYKGGWAKLMAGARPQIVSIRFLKAGDVRSPLLILFGAVGFVLLIACANVANLQLARAATRQKELAVRVALGAGLWRLARYLLMECLLLAMAGGAAGAALATIAIAALRALGPTNIPHLADIGLNQRALLFTVLLSITSGMVFAVAPIFAATKTDPNDSLKKGGLAFGPRGQRLRSLLAVAELSLALVLLTGSGLLIRSFTRLMTIDPGFKASHILTARVELPSVQYPKPEQQRAFFQNLLERLRTLPGVEAVDAGTTLPLKGSIMAANFDVEGHDSSQSDSSSTNINIVSPDYLRTMGIPLISGRSFNFQDSAASPKVIIINQAAARKYFPGESPVGKRIQTGPEEGWLTIIGVSNDVRQAGLAVAPEPEILESYLQVPYSAMTIVLRTTTDLRTLVPALRSQVQVVDKNLPLFEISTMERYLAEEVAGRRFNMLLLGIFAGVALLLAMVGIYGVIAYMVTQRTREIGIRMALGAQGRDMQAFILRRGVWLTTIGVVVGAAASWALSRVMDSLLYDVSPRDPATFVGVILLVMASAMLATYIPARRAAKVDPMVALRYE